jgi:hypothetical protein
MLLRGFQGYTQQFADGRQIQFGANHAQATNDSRCTETHIGLTGDVVEMDPPTICRRHNALGTQYHAVRTLVTQAIEFVRKVVRIKGLGGFRATTDKHVMGTVMMVMVSATPTTALFPVVMVMMVLVVTFAFLIVVMVMMVLVVTFAFLIVVMVMMVLVVTLAFLIVVMMMVMLVVAFALFIVVVVMMVMVLCFMMQTLHFSL